MKEISYTTFSKMVLFFHFFTCHLKYTRWSFPLWPLVGEWVTPAFHQESPEVAGVSNQTSSIASYLTWLDHSQHPCLAWGTHCASPKGTAADQTVEENRLQSWPSVQAWLSVWGTCWQMWTSNQLQGSQPWPSLAWLVLLLWANLFLFQLWFSGHHWLSTFIAFFFNGLTDEMFKKMQFTSKFLSESIHFPKCFGPSRHPCLKLNVRDISKRTVFSSSVLSLLGNPALLEHSADQCASPPACVW